MIRCPKCGGNRGDVPCAYPSACALGPPPPLPPILADAIAELSSTVLVRVVAPHFVAGVFYNVAEDRITTAAPILRYMIGWDRRRVAAFVTRKGWTAHVIASRAVQGSGVADVATHSDALTMNTPNPQNPNPNDPSNPNPQRGPGGVPYPGQTPPTNPLDPGRPDEREDDADARPSRR